MASFLQHYFKQNNTLMKNAIKSIHYKLVFLSFCMIAGIAAFAQDPATFSDVGRKRHVADTIECGEEIGDGRKANQTLAKLASLQNLGFEFNAA